MLWLISFARANSGWQGAKTVNFKMTNSCPYRGSNSRPLILKPSALSIAPCSLIYKQQFKTYPLEYRCALCYYSYIIQWESVFSFCRVFNIVVVWNGCHFAVWPISIGQTAKWHPCRMITLRNTWQNEHSLMHGTM